MRLDTHDHDRDGAGLKHIYPVVSRRAGGLSIGINLNPNTACNFRCVYCQVPELVAGKAETCDLDLLEKELREFLEWVLNGDFMESVVPEGSRRLNDLAFSGNGEPTSAPNFDETVTLVGRIMEEFSLIGQAKLILISNGSLCEQEPVQRGLQSLNQIGGEVWFKLDAATSSGQERINSYTGGLARVKKNLAACAGTAPTWLQTCLFSMDGEPPGREERAAYLDFLRWTRAASIDLSGVLLYGLARPSLQPEAERLAALDKAWLEAFAEEVRTTGLEVRVSP